MMTAARSADSGLAGPGELDRYPYADAPGADRAGAPSWDGARRRRWAGWAAARRGSRGRGLHGQLVQQLGQMIVSGDLGADRPLVPEEIGQRFEVSRTVVRESLRVLEAKGLVSARPNVGTRVRPVSDWNLLDPDIIEWRAFGPQRDDQRRELSELRWTIEPLAARLAAGHGREDVQQRLADMVEIMGHAAGPGRRAHLLPRRRRVPRAALQVAGNRMLEHLSGIVVRRPPGLRRPGHRLRPAHRGLVAHHAPDRRRARRRATARRPRRPCASCSPSTPRSSAWCPRRASTDPRRGRRGRDASPSRGIARPGRAASPVGPRGARRGNCGVRRRDTCRGFGGAGVGHDPRVTHLPAV